MKVFTQDIHEPAIRALVTNEELQASQMQLKSELEAKHKEVERLRRSEERSKEAIKVSLEEPEPNYVFIFTLAKNFFL